MSERVSVEQAAKEMGCGPQAVREQMKKKLIDIGYVAPAAQQNYRKTTYRNYIFRDKLNKLLGKETV